MQDAREHLACGTLFLTLGEKGMDAHRGQDGYPKFPTMAQEVCDVFGAGHTVTAGMAVVMAAGGTVMEAAVLANHAAAVEVGKAGVATVSPAEILTRFRTSTAEKRS